MKSTKTIGYFDLQLFADGAAAGASGATAGSDGASANGSVNGTTGDNTTAAGSSAVEETADRATQYAKFKEDYKAEYDADVQKLIKNRLHNAKTFESKVKPLHSMLAERYGVDESDIDALVNAVENDDSYYQEKALELGMTVENFKKQSNLERKVKFYENAENERQKQAVLDRINSQAEATKKVYPSFDINTESNNPEFARLVSRGVDVKTAYEVVHKDEIITSAMQVTAQKTADKLSASIASNASRPNENGMTSQSSAVSTVNVKGLTKEQMADAKKRAARGEKITFRDKQF